MMSREERAKLFFAKVRFPPTKKGCLEWIGCTSTAGYGYFSDGTRNVCAHRWHYEYVIGPIPPGLHIDHLCRNPRCVQVAHLEAVTPRENILRGEAPMARAWRNGTCTRGHAMTAENTLIHSSGDKKVRRCRECARVQAYKWHWAHREQRNKQSNARYHARQRAKKEPNNA